MIRLSVERGPNGGPIVYLPSRLANCETVEVVDPEAAVPEPVVEETWQFQMIVRSPEGHVGYLRTSLVWIEP